MNTLLNKFSNWLEKAILPVAEVLGRQRHLGALRDGIITLMPVTMVGAIVVLLKDVILTADSLAGTKLNSITFLNEENYVDKFLMGIDTNSLVNNLAWNYWDVCFKSMYDWINYYDRGRCFNV